MKSQALQGHEIQGITEDWDRWQETKKKPQMDATWKPSLDPGAKIKV